jgi:putative transcriptional regulator
LPDAEQRKRGIPSPAEVLEKLRSKPKRGTPSRTGSALPARRALRLSQREFARLIGTTPATVRNWEQGRTPVPSMAQKFMRVVERHPEILADLV